MPVDILASLSSSAPPTDFEQNTKIITAACAEYVTGHDTDWRKAFQEHPDPTSLIAVAEQHGVLPLLARNLCSSGIRCAPAERRAREIAVRNLALTSELVKLMCGFRDAGIEALAYKGPILGKQLYGDVTLRQFRDLDILVGPEDVFLARGELIQHGYEDVLPFSSSLMRKHVRSQCEWQLFGTDTGTLLELHWALFPHYASFDLCVSNLQQTRVDVEISGERLMTMGLFHLALVLSAHGTKHFWTRLGWLVDFALVLQKCAENNAAQLLDDAARRGMRRILLISAILANKVLQLRLPVTFEDSISGDSQAQVLADSMERMLRLGTMPADLLSENLLLLSTRERWLDRVKIVSRLAFTPGPEEWRSVALPKSAELLYRPIRLARAARYLPQLAKRTFSSRKL